MDGFAHEVGKPVDVEAGLWDFVGAARGDLFDLFPESGCDGFVGVEDEDPVGFDWQVREGPVLLFGVSVLKVVATIDTPISHHGAARPDVKNSAVLRPARRMSSSAGVKVTEKSRLTKAGVL